MKVVTTSRLASISASMLMLASSLSVMAQSPTNCTEISDDVRIAVEKDPAKVLMVVEDALVINEGCAADIVKAAIIASKADAPLASQIVQTAVSVAPKMAGVINESANSVIPGLAAIAPADESVRPVTSGDKNPVASLGKNPGKNPIVTPDPVEEDFFVPATIRGVYLIQPPASGPLPCDPTNRICDPNPVSPAVAIH